MHDEIYSTLTRWGVPSHMVPHLALMLEAIIRGGTSEPVIPGHRAETEASRRPVP
jgi:hypothetical protein